MWNHRVNPFLSGGAGESTLLQTFMLFGEGRKDEDNK